MFGVDYEMDLLPFWGQYYLDMGLDSYKIFLHKETGEVGENIRQEFKHLGFSIETVGGPQGNGVLRKLVLGHYAGTLPPDDILITADADEFQCYPQVSCGTDTPLHSKLKPPDYRNLMKSFDVIMGFMQDRYADRLESCYKNPFHQYPHVESYTRDILKAFTPPFLRKTVWPVTRRTKILAAPAGSLVAFEGSHAFLCVPGGARIADDFRVVHFAWRESAKHKAVVKSYFNHENLDEIFGGETPPDQMEVYNRMQPEGILNV